MILEICAIVSTALLVFSQPVIVTPANNKYGVPYNWGSAIAMYDVKTNEFRVIYKNNDLVFFGNRLKVSPSGLLIGAIGYERDRKGKVDVKSMLIVIDTNGNILSRVDDAVIFDWAPTSDKIVYGTGILYTDTGYPKANRLWIYVIKSANKEDIGVSSAWNLSWATFDSLIYIHEKGGIFKIDPSTQLKIKTQYWDLNFSPDGKYYYIPNREGGGFYLFETKSNHEIALPDINKKENRINYWLGKDELVVGDGIRDNRIINIVTGESKKAFSGRLIGYFPETSDFYVYKDKRFFKELADSKIEKFKYPSE